MFDCLISHFDFDFWVAVSLDTRRVSSVSGRKVHVPLAQRSAGALGVNGACRGLCEQTTHTRRSQNLFLVSEALEGGGQVDGRFDGCVPLRHVRLRIASEASAASAARCKCEAHLQLHGRVRQRLQSRSEVQVPAQGNASHLVHRAPSRPLLHVLAQGVFGRSLALHDAADCSRRLYRGRRDLHAFGS